MSVNVELLKALATNDFLYVSTAEREPLIAAAYVESNPEYVDPTDADKIGTRITDAGRAYLASLELVATPSTTTETKASAFEIISDVEIPKSRRGFGGGNRAGKPAKYPFDKLEVNQTFFVPATDKIPEPEKSLAGAVSAANHRHAVEKKDEHGNVVTREVKKYERDGRKFKVDAEGNKIAHTVIEPELEYTRKFVVRGVEAGKTYGGWTAPSNGAIIARVQ